MRRPRRPTQVVGELLGLQWGDFDKAGRALHVRRQWTRLGEYGPPKTQSPYRRVPLSADLAACLIRLRLRSGHSSDADPIFASRRGTPLSHRNFATRGFEEARGLAEIDGVTPHDMRHAFASRMIFRGVSAEFLAQLMGHESSIVTRRKYIHLFNQGRDRPACSARDAVGVTTTSSPLPCPSVPVVGAGLAWQVDGKYSSANTGDAALVCGRVLAQTASPALVFTQFLGASPGSRPGGRRFETAQLHLRKARTGGSFVF